MSATEPYHSYRPVNLWIHHGDDESDNCDSNKDLMSERAAHEQQQKDHSHSGIFALVFGNGSLEGISDEVFHACIYGWSGERGRIRTSSDSSLSSVIGVASSPPKAAEEAERDCRRKRRAR